MSSSSSTEYWTSEIDYLGPMELTDLPIELMSEEYLTAILNSQEFPKLILYCSFPIKNIYESSSSFGQQDFWVEEEWNTESRYAVHDLRCFTDTLSLAKLSIRLMMAQTSASWVMRLPSDILESMITKIASDLMTECRLINEGSNTALGYASIPCFQLEVSLVMIIDDDEEELNFRLAAQQSLDDAERDDDVLQCCPVIVELWESLVTEIVGEIPEDDKEECVICKDEFVTGIEVKRLPCSHRFHEQCITSWFQVGNTCPLCRHSIQV